MVIFGNAFLRAYTKEKLYTKCGPEFGEHRGQTEISVKSLYGLTTTRIAQLRNLFADKLRTWGQVAR